MSNKSTEGNPITLHVAGAQARDAGRGIARLDPRDIERLGASISDVVEVRGGRATVAKLMTARQADRGKGVGPSDGRARPNPPGGPGQEGPPL